MDKRYLLMLTIVVICCINLSIIVNNSDIIGSASVSAGNYLFSAPDGFSLYENNGNSAVIRNNNNMKIYFESELSDLDNFNKRLNYIENETSDTILSKGTLSVENISVNTIYYKTSDNHNNSAFYFEKYNTTFKIIISNFNYNTDRDLTLDYVTSIIQSTHLNYKSD